MSTSPGLSQCSVQATTVVFPGARSPTVPVIGVAAHQAERLSAGSLKSSPMYTSPTSTVSAAVIGYLRLDAEVWAGLYRARHCALVIVAQNAPDSPRPGASTISTSRHLFGPVVTLEDFGLTARRSTHWSHGTAAVAFTLMVSYAVRLSAADLPPEICHPARREIASVRLPTASTSNSRMSSP